MFLDTIHGTIDRRVLLNYRLDAAILQRILPSPFRPKLFRGSAIGGVCMIRFKGLRPRLMPQWLGLGSENAAHRFAVEWEQDGQAREGVFIPRRDTNSWFNHRLGGRVFPGIFERSRFEANETDDSVSLRVVRADGGTEIAFRGHRAETLPSDSLFASLEAAAGFFSLGATGYSATRVAGHYHGMDLESKNWSVSALEIEEARSCFFDDTARFPIGTAQLDCALLMRGIEHQWRSQPDINGATGDASRSIAVLNFSMGCKITGETPDSIATLAQILNSEEVGIYGSFKFAYESQTLVPPRARRFSQRGERRAHRSAVAACACANNRGRTRCHHRCGRRAPDFRRFWCQHGQLGQ